MDFYEGFAYLRLTFEGLATDESISAVLACLGAGALLTPLVALTVSAASGLAECLRYGAGVGWMVRISFQISAVAAGWALAWPPLAGAVAADKWATPEGELASFGTLVLGVLVIGGFLAALVRVGEEVSEFFDSRRGGVLREMRRGVFDPVEHFCVWVLTKVALGKDRSVKGLAGRRAWLESRVRWLEDELAPVTRQRRRPVSRLRRRWTLFRKTWAATRLSAVREALEEAEEDEDVELDDLLLEDEDRQETRRHHGER